MYRSFGPGQLAQLRIFTIKHIFGCCFFILSYFVLQFYGIVRLRTLIFLYSNLRMRRTIFLIFFNVTIFIVSLFRLLYFFLLLVAYIFSPSFHFFKVHVHSCYNSSDLSASNYRHVNKYLIIGWDLPVWLFSRW